MGHKGGERRGGGEGSQGGRREGVIIPQLWKEKIEYFLANAVCPDMIALPGRAPAPPDPPGNRWEPNLRQTPYLSRLSRSFSPVFPPLPMGGT